MNEIRHNQLKNITEKLNFGNSPFEVIILKGETGIGKTYLIESFLNTCENKDVLISSSLCNYQTGKYEPYLPFKQLLNSLIDVCQKENSEELKSSFYKKALFHSAKALIDVAPDLIDTFVPAGSLVTKFGGSLFKDVDFKSILKEKIEGKKKEGYQLEERQIHKQYLSFLRSLSSESPIILVLEDIQWLDEASINLLLPLTQKLQDCPISVILSYRSNEVNKKSSLYPTLIELRRNLGDIELDLDFNSKEAKLSMVHSILDEEKNELDEKFRSKMLSISNGNPMFINELMQSLKESHQVCLNSDGVLICSDSLDWNEIPEKLEAVVLGRLSKLEDKTRSLLSSASVQGSSFLVQVMGKIDQISDRDLIRIFARSLIKEHKLLKEGKVQRVNNKILSFFHFSNGLIQHYLYNDLMYSERMLYHQEIAEVLIEIYKGCGEQAFGLIAYHYEKAEIPEEAIIYYKKAGESSIKISAYKEASFLFGKALDLIDNLILDDKALWEPIKLKLLVQKSVALKPNEGWISDKVFSLYYQAYEIGLRLKDFKTLAPVTFGLWVKHLMFLELDDALIFAESYLETAENMKDSAIILDAKICICNTNFWMGNVDKTLLLANEVLNAYDEELHMDQTQKFGQDPRAFAYMFKILSLSLLSDKEDANRLAERSLKWAKSLKHPFTETIILQAITWLYFQEGEFSKIEKVCTELIEISQKHDFGFYLGVGQIFFSSWLIENRKYGEAKQLLELGYHKNLLKDGGIAFNSLYSLFKSKVEFGQEKNIDSLNTIDKAIELAEKQKELLYYPLLLHQKAIILKKINRVEESEILIENANNFSRKNKMLLFIN